MNCSVVSERRKWWETECSLRTCTTLTNGSAISTNTLTDMGSTDRTELERHICHPEKGNRTYPSRERALRALCNKAGLLWNLICTVLRYSLMHTEVCLLPSCMLFCEGYLSTAHLPFLTVRTVYCCHFQTLAHHVWF